MLKFGSADLDVHQGNGQQRSKLHFGDTETFVVDVYNADVFPRDHQARYAIDVERRMRSGQATEAYLTTVREALEEAFQRCSPPPQLLVYNAGTDILNGDPLGLFHVSPSGVIERDEIVMTAALRHGVPVVMLLSGGYTDASTRCIADSLENIDRRFWVFH
jgi:histone deacetylase 11